MSDSISVHHLRRRWKSHKVRLQEICGQHPTNIRFHRACSWLAETENKPADSPSDISLITQWIAFNSLYGQWDAQLCQPVPDIDSWRTFVRRLLELDAQEIIVAALVRQKKLVVSIVEDAFLSRFFWKQRPEERTFSIASARQQCHRLFEGQEWHRILEEVLYRIYLLRCQLTHGAATFGSRLNRSSIRRCNTMLSHLLGAFLEVFVDQGADEDWGLMCYPPM